MKNIYCIQNEENEKKNGYLYRIKGYKILLVFHLNLSKV